MLFKLYAIIAFSCLVAAQTATPTPTPTPTPISGPEFSPPAPIGPGGSPPAESSPTPEVVILAQQGTASDGIRQSVFSFAALGLALAQFLI
jgi:hypothetical protein